MRILGIPGALRLFFVVCLSAGASAPAYSVSPVSSAGTMVPLEEAEMAGVTGAGLAFALDDFSMRFAPTSFIELTGTMPDDLAALAGWQRGDARYYGLSMTSGSPEGTTWYGSACDTSGPAGALACPMGTGNGMGITGFASAYDPFLLRVFQYPGYTYITDSPAGDYRDSNSSSPMPTVMELVGPSQTDDWRWAFWGELEVGRNVNNPDVGACNNSTPGCVNGADFLQSQTIILGKPVAYDHRTDENRPAILRLMRTEDQDNLATFGITYNSALSGDFRFSVAQTGDSPNRDKLHRVPDFDSNEGMFFKNVDAFLPLGTLHYQAITFDAARTPGEEGNFIIELSRIPDNPAVYNNFYCGATPDNPGCALNPDGSIANPNADTLGFVRWGDWSAALDTNGNLVPAGLPNGTSTDNGIFFVGNSSTPANPVFDQVTNLGISRIEGMRIHHMKITTLGAGAP